MVRLTSLVAQQSRANVRFRRHEIPVGLNVRAPVLVDPANVAIDRVALAQIEHAIDAALFIRDAQILRRRYSDGEPSYWSLGDEFWLSHARIGQILHSAEQHVRLCLGIDA